MPKVPADLTTPVNEILAPIDAKRDNTSVDPVRKPRGRYDPNRGARSVILFDPHDPFEINEGKQWGTRGYDPQDLPERRFRSTTTSLPDPDPAIIVPGIAEGVRPTEEQQRLEVARRFWKLLGVLQRTWEYPGLMHEFEDKRPIAYLIAQMALPDDRDHVRNLLEKLLRVKLELTENALATLSDRATVEELASALSMSDEEKGEGDAYRVVFFLIHHIHQQYIDVHTACK
jgi:hypothetical protein